MGTAIFTKEYVQFDLTEQSCGSKALITLHNMWEGTKYKAGLGTLSMSLKDRASTLRYIGISDTKTDAIIKAKELISLYKKDIYGKTVYVADDIDFTLIYKEPKTNHLGIYILFMVDAEDVRLKKRRDMGFE